MSTPIIAPRALLHLGVVLALVLVPFLVPRLALGEDPDPRQPPWTLRTRVTLSGNADESEPPGFTAYSGVALEAAVNRSLGRRLAAEVNLRTESREIDREVGNDPVERLGSLELLPLTFALQ